MKQRIDVHPKYMKYSVLSMQASDYYKQSEEIRDWKEMHCNDDDEPDFMIIPYGDQIITSVEIYIKDRELATLFKLQFVIPKAKI